MQVISFESVRNTSGKTITLVKAQLVTLVAFIAILAVVGASVTGIASYALVKTDLEQSQKVVNAQTALIAELRKENAELNLQRSVLVDQLSAANTKLQNAMIPEATIGEAVRNHITKPVTERAVNAYNSVASKVSSLWNGQSEK